VGISVIVTSYNDHRIENTLKSLSLQTTKPQEILVADGGTRWDIKSICDRYNARLEIIRGNVPETRSVAIKLAIGDVIAFIDTDEIAPPEWLSILTKPILSGEADFTGGPTKHKPAKSQAELYVNMLEDNLYETLVKRDIRYLPMGNSAWSRKVFDQVGTFDATLVGSEDYDINIRALRAHFTGKFVQDAWVYHDHSEINTARKLFKKRYRYLKTTALLYIEKEALVDRLSIGRRKMVKHPYAIIEAMLKPVAFMDAVLRGYL
jgi:glycosyltransferase involved in cell wall biosynthesis